MSKSQALQSLLAFPSFQSCPAEGDIDFQYYGTEDGTYYRPSRHWCLLAEVVQVEFFLRLRLQVRDRAGHELPVAFYPDGEEEPTPEHYKSGYTIAILYPHQHGFLDMSTGIRQETMRAIQVIPLALAEVIRISETTPVQPVCCQICEVPGKSVSKCGRCGLRWYCGKDCQRVDWVQHNHKANCKGLSLVQRLLMQDWNSFDDFLRFPL